MIVSSRIDLSSDGTYTYFNFGITDVFRDIQDECEKYGPTRSMLLPKEGPGRGKVG